MSKTLIAKIPFSNWLDDPDNKMGGGTDIDIHVAVTYLPHPGCPDYFSTKHSCWFPGEQPSIEVISVNWIPGEKLDDMSLWSRIEAKMLKDMAEDDLELREHFQDQLEKNADERDDSGPMRDAINELLHNRTDLLHQDDRNMLASAVGQ